MDGLDNLEGLAAQADAVGGAPAAEGAAEGQQPGQGEPDYGHEAAMCVDLFVGMVCGYAPRAESVWTEPAKHRTALALAPVLRKYGITLDNLPVELTLALVAGPLMWQSAKVVAAQMQQDRAQAQPKAKTATVVEVNPAPEQTGAPGQKVHSQVQLYANGGGV